MIIHKMGLKSLVHFNGLQPNMEYEITLVGIDYSIPVKCTVKTNKDGEISNGGETELPLFERTVTHGGVG